MGTVGTIGQGTGVSYADGVVSRKDSAYSTSIAKILDLFKSNPGLQIEIGKYLLKLDETGKIVIYEKQDDGSLKKSEKTLQDVLTSEIGKDKRPYLLSDVIKKLIALGKDGQINLSNKGIDLKAFVKLLKDYPKHGMNYVSQFTVNDMNAASFRARAAYREETQRGISAAKEAIKMYENASARLTQALKGSDERLRAPRPEIPQNITTWGNGPVQFGFVDTNKDNKVNLKTERHVYITLNKDGQTTTIKVKEGFATMLAQGMLKAGKNDGVISQAEFGKRFLAVLDRYLKLYYDASLKDVSFANLKAAIEDFNQTDTSGFEDQNFKDLEAQKAQLASEISKHNPTPGKVQVTLEAELKFTPENALGTAELVKNVPAGKLTASRIASAVLLYAVKYGSYTGGDILAWAKTSATQADGVELTTATLTKEVEDRIEKEVLSWKVKDRGVGAVKRAAQELVAEYAGSKDPKKIGIAVALLKKIPEKAKEKGDAYFDEVKNLSDYQVYGQIANGYLSAQKYEAAFEYAKKAGTNSGKLLQQILTACIDKPTHYDLALKLLTYKGWDPENQEQYLNKLAKAYLDTKDDQNVRAKALIALKAIAAKNPNYKVQVQKGSYGQREVDIKAYIIEITDELRLPLIFVQIQDSVFPSGAKTPTLGNVATAAIDKLKVIIKDPKTSELEKAYALDLIAAIYLALGDQSWKNTKVKISEFKKSQAFQYYELAAKSSRQASIAFMALRDKTSAKEPELSNYYEQKYLHANSLIANLIVTWKKLWQNKGFQNAYREDNWPSVLKAFQELAKYVPAKSRVVLSQNQGEEPETSSRFKQTANLVNDEEHPMTAKFMLEGSEEPAQPKATQEKAPTVRPPVRQLSAAERAAAQAKAAALAKAKAETAAKATAAQGTNPPAQTRWGKPRQSGQ